MKTAAIYCRVSTIDQARHGTSLSSQLEACRQYAREQGYEIMKELDDQASGTLLARQGLDELRDIASSGQVEAILCYEPDRLARNTAHALLLGREFEQEGVQLVFVHLDGQESQRDQLPIGMRSAFAEFEAEQMDERVRRGKRQSAKDGHVIMSAYMPYGYTFIKGEGRLQIIEAEAEHVRKMYQWVAFDKCSLYEVVRRLHAAGVLTQKGNKRWYRSAVNNILSSSTYMGIWIYNRYVSITPAHPKKPENQWHKSSRITRPRSDWIEVDVPAIVSVDLFEAAQAQLERNRLLYSRPAKQKFMLGGMITCGRCGYALFGHSQIKGRKTKKTQRCYKCAGRFEHHRHLPVEERCPTPGRSADRLDELVWGEITRQLSNPQVTLVTEECEQVIHEHRRRADDELTALCLIEEQTKRELDKLIDLHMADIIDRDTLQERMSLVKRRQQAAEKARLEVSARIKQHDRASRQTQVLLEVREQIREPALLTIEAKRQLLEVLQTNIRVTDDEMLITGILGSTVLKLR